MVRPLALLPHLAEAERAEAEVEEAEGVVVVEELPLRWCRAVRAQGRRRTTVSSTVRRRVVAGRVRLAHPASWAQTALHLCHLVGPVAAR